jgi:tRNA-binding protein
MNEVNVFYNLEGIGDTLIVALQDITLENRTFDRKGDVARVYDRESNVTAGFNIFNASSYLEVKETGNLTLTKEFVEKINGILARTALKKQ